MLPALLPIPAAPARYETLASYLGRLARLHGMPARQIWETVSTPRPGTSRRDVHPARLAALVGRDQADLARALPELKPHLDWNAWRHQPQPGCPRCDARHDGGPVQRLLPHHRYVCTRHRYWIGPPDVGQPATALASGLDEITRAQFRHQRLLRRHGPATSYDAVLTGFLICGHAWDDRGCWDQMADRWRRRSAALIPEGTEDTSFSASRIFATIYPEAVAVADLIASPTWRRRACGNHEQRQQFMHAIGARLGRPDYQPPEHGDAIAHWMQRDAWRPPSTPTRTYPNTRDHGATRPYTSSRSSIARQRRSAYWFAVNRRGGNVILHHRHITPVLVRDWSPPKDGIEATIWASRTTLDSRHDENPGLAQDPG